MAFTRLVHPLGFVRLFFVTAVLATGLAILTAPVAASPAGFVRLPGQMPAAVAHARPLGQVSLQERVTLALTLPLRSQSELDSLLARLYDPTDPLYHDFLTPQEFTRRFGPTQADYNAVAAFAQAHGLAVVGTHPNRTVLDVAGTAGAVENAFQVRLGRYQAADRHVFRAPDSAPSIPAALAAQLSGIVGLDTASVRQPQAVPLESWEAPLQIGTGVGGALAPGDIRAAIGLGGSALTGAGQTLGLFELDGYNASDIAAYESYYHLPATPIQNVLIDGATGAVQTSLGASEVTLDIELMLGLAPEADKMLVYIAPNSDAGTVDAYNRIANDNLAKQISTSWGLPEQYNLSATRNAENTAFQQMAAQGQSIFSASGDNGAKDDRSTLSVDDPASQPYVTGVGGTRLSVNSAGGSWKAETTWSGSGGGISALWPIPTWQQGAAPANANGSTTMRMVPDVAFDADPNTGYSAYFNGGWTAFGGTSCAAPVWAGFMALVNQQRALNGQAALGFANPPLYALGMGAHAAQDFHDIADGSTNQYYPAVAGYDLATGWGSFNGPNLLADLAPASAPSAPAAPTGLTAAAGNSQVTLSWTASTGASTYSVYRSSSSSGGETLYVGNVAGTSYTDTGVASGSTYYYEVTAVNSTGESPKSNEASATPVAPGFTLAASPTSVSVVRGGTGTSTLTVGALNGFSGSVSLSASGLPSGVTAAFSPTAVSGSDSSGLTLTAAANASLGTATVTITGTSGGTTHTTTISLSVNAAPDFSLSAAPSSLSVVQGSSGTSTISVGALNGFSSAVALSASGLPSGVSAAFSPASVSGAGSNTLTLTVGASATVGVWNLIVTGVGGGGTHTAHITLTVTQARPGAPTGLTATPGNAQVSLSWGAVATASSYNIYRASSSGAEGATPIRTGLTSPSYIDTGLTNGATYYYQVTAVNAGGESPKSNEASATPQAPDFTLAASPASFSAAQGGSGACAITVSPQHGFTGTVSFAAAGLPDGVTAAFSPSSVVTSGATTLTLHIAAGAATGTYAITIKGTSGNLSHTVNVTLAITARPDFTVLANPSSLSIVQGGSGTSTITIAALNGFRSSVSLSVSGLPAGVSAAFSPASVAGAGSSALTLTVSSAAMVGTVTVTVTAVSGSLTHAATIALTVIQERPAAPTNLIATAGNAVVSLSWTASAGATAYNVYRGTSPGGEAAAPLAAGVAIAAYTDTTVTSGVTYYYVVTAVNSGGESTRSNEANATPTATHPSGPTPVAGGVYPTGLNFIALPADYSSVPLDSVFGFPGALLAVWQPTSFQYALTPVAPADHIRLGQGYWVRFPQAVTVATQGTPADPTHDFSMGLPAGWNQIGDPFTSNVAVSSLMVASGGQNDTFAQATSSARLIGAILYRYDQSLGYVAVTAGDSLQPGQGYWLLSYSAIALTVPHP